MNDDVALAIDVLSENGCHFLRSTLDEVGKDDRAGNRNAAEDPAKAKLSELKGGDIRKRVSVKDSSAAQQCCFS